MGALAVLTLTASTLGVIVNDADPLSVQIGEYYQSRRHIPAGNVVHVRFDASSAALSRDEFARIAREVEGRMPRDVQAYALTWAKPYRVDCVSVTYAFSTNIEDLTCAQGCSATQMSSLRWLEAGATGSYGAVVEPCNVTAKFPNVALMMKHYLAGETLIEAYWKSVAMPAQRIFIGEPLARPWG
jgi:hypothetical protein